jgi:hypothetical protein
VVHEDTAHHFGSQGEEVRAISPIGVMLVDEAQVSFVDERRRLQNVPRPLAP